MSFPYMASQIENSVLVPKMLLYWNFETFLKDQYWNREQRKVENTEDIPDFQLDFFESLDAGKTSTTKITWIKNYGRLQ